METTGIQSIDGFENHKQISAIHAGIILCMRPANERRRYNVPSSFIGWAHTQNDPYSCMGM